MRAGRPKSMRLNALLAAVAGAAISQSERATKARPEVLPVAVYVRERRAGQVPNKTKRGVRRAQTRRRS